MQHPTPDTDDLRPASFGEEVTRDLRGQYRKLAIRYTIAFLLLFAGVYAAIWWSTSSVKFAAARTGGRAVPTWTVRGVARNAVTHGPVPWAVVSDDPSGQPPFHRTETNLHGAYELLTFAEPHRLRIVAAGYRPAAVNVGKVWFLWRPRGEEIRDIELVPEP